MCSAAPEIIYQFRKLVGTDQSVVGKSLQEGTSRPVHFLAIGPSSEWHQAIALWGNERRVFSVRAPLILPNDPPATIQIRPYFEGAYSGAFVRQPRFDGSDRKVIVDGDPAAAFLEVIGYNGVPPVWPFARPDMQYSDGNLATSSAAPVVLSVPVMGRARFSAYFRNDTGGSLSYRFTGCMIIDDSMHEATILPTTTTTDVEISRHLDIGTDAFQWIRMYDDTAAGGFGPHSEVSFLVRD